MDADKPLTQEEVGAIACAAHRLHRLGDAQDQDLAAALDRIVVSRGYLRCGHAGCERSAITRLGFCGDHG